MDDTQVWTAEQGEQGHNIRAKKGENMNSNQTVLEVLAQEGVSVTEGELLRAVRQPPGESTSSQAAVADRPSVQERPPMPSLGSTAQGQFAKQGRMTNPMPTQNPDPRTGGPLWEVARGITRALREAWNFLFAALREAYWLLDRDAKVRSQGLQTVGRVDGTKSEEHTDPEPGSTSYTHYVTYAYQADGESHTARKRVGSLGNLRKGAAIRVYYLPGSYPLASALDTAPRTLAEREQMSLEASPGRTESGYAKITNGS